MNLSENPLVKKYLDEVCRKVRSKRAHAEIRVELLNHMEESVARRLVDGASVEQAIEAALLDLGEPQGVGAGLNRVHPPFYLDGPTLLSAFICMTIAGTAFCAAGVVWGERYVRARYAQILSKNRERFLEDQRVLSQEAFFRFSGKKADAGVVFNSRILWGGAGRAPYQHLNVEADLIVTESILSKLDLPQHPWLELVDQNIKLPELKWMSELAPYDHWDVFRAGPIARVIEEHGSKLPWWAMPLPDYSQLRAYAKLRLVAGLRDGRILQALKEVRHFSQLLYSHEVLMASLVAVAILKTEKEAYDYAVVKGLLAPSDWRPMSEETLTRARRTIYGYPQMFRVENDISFVRDLFLSSESRVGYCSGLSESMFGEAMKREFLSPHYPLEVDYRRQFEALDEVFAHARQYCRLSFAGKVWDHPESTRDWYRGLLDGSDYFLWYVLGKIPVLRQGVQHYYAWRAVPDYLTNPYAKHRLKTE